MSRSVRRVETEGTGGVVGLAMKLVNLGLRRRRLELGWRQKDLADEVGISAVRVSRIEMLRDYPDDDLAKEIGKALHARPQRVFPPWLELFTRPKESKAEVVVELPQNIVDSAVLARALGQGKVWDPDRVIEQLDAQEAVPRLLAALNPREKEVIERRLGFGDYGDEETQEKIADDLGVSSERVSKIEAKAKQKMRREAWRRRISV